MSCQKCKNLISGKCKDCGRHAGFIRKQDIPVEASIHDGHLIAMHMQIASAIHKKYGEIGINVSTPAAMVYVTIGKGATGRVVAFTPSALATAALNAVAEELGE